jgi:argininosuccinate lyase
MAFRPERTEAACTPELLATYRALRRVDEGVPFRTAYREAAQETGEALAPAALLGAYRTAGSPGQERPGAVRDRLADHDWVDRST